MSLLKVDTIQNTSGTNLVTGVGNIVDSNFAYYSGAFYMQYDGTTPTRLPMLTLQIKPKKTTNIISCWWAIQQESHNNTSYRLMKSVNNGAWTQSTTNGEYSYNQNAGNQRWSGISHTQYDGDNNSTIQQMHIRYDFVAATTQQIKLALAVISSDNSGRNLTFNRTSGGWGGGSYENTVSHATLFEIGT